MSEVKRCPDCGYAPDLYQRERPQQFKIRCNRPYCDYNCVVVARTRKKATAKWNKKAERFTQAEWKKVKE